MRERELTLNLRITEEERAKLKAVAEAADETASQTIRKFIRQRYAAEFGDTLPRTPVTKSTPGRKPR